MTQFRADTVARALVELAQRRQAGGPLLDLRLALTALQAACRDLPLSPSFKEALERLIMRSNAENASLPVVIEFVQEMELNLYSELRGFGFFAVPPIRTEAYTDPEAWFGRPAIHKLPDARRDVIDACRCYALGQWTASVFHSMRVLEVALRTLAAHVDVTLQFPLALADWQVLLDKVDAEIDARRKTPKSQARSDELAALSRSAAELSYCKHAWRDHVCHAREHYNEENAIEILGHVKNIMADLASRLP